MAALNCDTMSASLLTMFCHKHAVRASWETAKSLCRRISPAIGERTSPEWEVFLFHADVRPDEGHMQGFKTHAASGKRVPFKRTSRKTWESKVPTVLSKGVPGMLGSTTSAAAMVCDASSATTSGGENPASAKRARIAVTESVGSGTVKSGAAAFGAGRPNLNWRRGAPGQFAMPTAAARWMKSPALRVPICWKTGH